MPRVANPPGARGTRQLLATPHKQSPMKLALNDDRREKAERLKSRQALREVDVNDRRAAASPAMAKLRPDDESPDSPYTPRSAAAEARRRAAQGTGTDSPGALNVVSHSSVTPMKRVPILANFEEWMKMATDNKINATNSWNFALIDYFHDMSLLKEGDGVNFQKASCTLDGCVKIYTSRVDSVATETGRLLSGLADSGEKSNKKGTREEGDEADGEDDEDDEDGEEGAKKRSKKRAARSHEATLAPSFASLQLKKLELEFAVDPLFKKASADFDEGGAKGLLLNHLSIDGEGRIVFDSSDDAGDVMVGDGEARHIKDSKESETTEHNSSSTQESEGRPRDDEDDIDLTSLAVKYFPDLSTLDFQDVCPSMKTFKLGDASGDLNIPFLKAPDDWRSPLKDKSKPPPSMDLSLGDQTGIFLDGTNAVGFDDDDNDGLLGGFDMADNVGFGEGGEAWAKDAALEPMLRVSNADEDRHEIVDGEEGDDGTANAYTVSLQHRFREDSQHASILDYFDKAFNSKKARAAWAKGQGLEYWRIAKIQLQQQKAKSGEDKPQRRERKEKEPFEIDFLNPMSEELKELLAAPPATTASISLPRAQWKTKGRNLLDPDDGIGEVEYVDGRALMRLWLKPKMLIQRRKLRKAADGSITTTSIEKPASEEEGRKGDYDANFFADDNEGLPFDVPLPIDDDDEPDLLADGMGNSNDGDSQGDIFVDAREMLSPPPPSTTDGGGALDAASDHRGGLFGSQALSQTDMLPGSFGSQLLAQGGGLAGRKLRPEYVNYARVAKKVDVRRLKENLWKGMEETLVPKLSSDSEPTTAASTNGPPTPSPSHPDGDGDIDMMDIDEPEPPPHKAEQALQQEPEALEKDTSSSAGELKFTDMISSLRSVYPEQQMKDISTSYCFICLLHLANEKGLVLESDRTDEAEEGGGGGGSMQEILVRRDLSVGEGYVGE